MLIVATHCTGDQHPDLDYPHLQQEFPEMLAGHFEVDNQTGHGIPELRHAIAEQAARLPQMGQNDQLPMDRGPRRDHRPGRRREPQMSFEDFAALCQRHQVDGEETGTLAELMHDPGPDHLLRRR